MIDKNKKENLRNILEGIETFSEAMRVISNEKICLRSILPSTFIGFIGSSNQVSDGYPKDFTLRNIEGRTDYAIVDINEIVPKDYDSRTKMTNEALLHYNSGIIYKDIRLFLPGTYEEASPAYGEFQRKKK